MDLSSDPQELEKEGVRNGPVLHPNGEQILFSVSLGI